MPAHNTPRERGSQSPNSNSWPELFWRDQPGDYFCISTKLRRSGAWDDKLFPRDKLHKVADYIRDATPDADVYFATNGFREPRRWKECAIRGVWLYADLDEVNPLKLDPEPTIAIKTSPGRYQAWWRCDGLVSEDLARVLRSHVKADRDSFAANKVLRIPGTINYKPEYDRPRVRLLWDDGPTHRVSDLERRLVEPRRERWRKRWRHSDTATPVLGWRNLTGKELACQHFELEPNLFAKRWHKRFIVIHGVWKSMVERGASLAMIVHALNDCPAWHSKVEEHGERWERREIEKIEKAIEDRT